ncbi:MAG: Crp/Fnr family transcriptional regulator [Bacteroidales bacterium]|nr:Crp/Fnr family transcriptional regulator [Bacteroidales bacterium]
MLYEICEYCHFKSAAVETLDYDELKELEGNCFKTQFSKGDLIFKQDALSSNIIFIREGLVKIHIKGPEREQIIKINKGPTFLGIPTTFGDVINHYSATAITSVNVCFISTETFRRFIYSNGKFAYEILNDLCKCELHTYKYCVNHLQKQGPGRLAEALIYLANDIFDSNSFVIPMTRHELGDLACCSRESVSRLLNELKKDNIIHLDGKKITILNEKLLSQISKRG